MWRAHLEAPHLEAKQQASPIDPCLGGPVSAMMTVPALTFVQQNPRGRKMASGREERPLLLSATLHVARNEVARVLAD